MNTEVDIQSYVDAVAELFPGVEFSVGSAAQVENAYKIPGSDFYINPDSSEVKIDPSELVKALKTAKLRRETEAEELASTVSIDAVIDHYITGLAENGYPNITPATLSLVMFDAASQTNWKLCSPELKALLAKLAKTAP